MHVLAVFPEQVGGCWIFVGVVIFLISTRRSRRITGVAAPTTVVLLAATSDDPGTASSLRDCTDRWLYAHPTAHMAG